MRRSGGSGLILLFHYLRADFVIDKIHDGFYGLAFIPALRDRNEVPLIVPGRDLIEDAAAFAFALDFAVSLGRAARRLNGAAIT